MAEFESKKQSEAHGPRSVLQMCCSGLDRYGIHVDIGAGRAGMCDRNRVGAPGEVWTSVGLLPDQGTCLRIDGG